ncbi:hypothetical protein [Thalassotalea sp. ND16A]|uniref:hypothetical protein n=1 Tax=Thalassotalea sp. ND16A TaxID=1535422 RepID=UPI00051A15A2|nr:hypothetical protein [Thalassotalea sp. ND16A]KGJ95998.1 hypothetical protein ND16A_1177 [Thalassotalea sp. ND16A]
MNNIKALLILIVPFIVGLFFKLVFKKTNLYIKAILVLWPFIPVYIVDTNYILLFGPPTDAPMTAVLYFTFSIPSAFIGLYAYSLNIEEMMSKKKNKD